MGTIKTTNIETITGSGTLTLGQSGETISVPSGATINLSNATQTGVGGVNTPAFRVYRNSSVTLSSGTNTIVTFDQENFDTGSMYDTSNGKFTPTESGKYYIFAMVSWDLGGGINYIELRKNGSNISSNYTNISSLASGRYVFHIHNIVEADGDDYFEINVYQGSGSDKTLHSGTANTFFGGYKIIE